MERLRRLSAIQWVLIGIVVLVVGTIAVTYVSNASERERGGGNGGGGSTPADRYLADYGGSRAVYQGILSSTNCAALQTQFDTASANHDRADPGSDAARWTTGYMVAIDERMQAVGCY